MDNKDVYALRELAKRLDKPLLFTCYPAGLIQASQIADLAPLMPQALRLANPQPRRPGSGAHGARRLNRKPDLTMPLTPDRPCLRTPARARLGLRQTGSPLPEPSADASPSPAPRPCRVPS